MNRSRIIIFLTLVVVLVFQAAANAQVAGPVLERGVFEAGYTYKWFHRDMEPHPPVDKDWEVGALYVRYGLVRSLTISLEGGVWNVTHEDFEGMDYLRFTLGGGFTAGLFEVRDILLSGSYYYNEVFDYDRSPAQFNKNTRGETLTIQAEKWFEISRFDLAVWGGPAYVKDTSRNYIWGTNDPLLDESTENWGIIAGLNAVAYDRVTVAGYVLYANYWQPRFQLGVRL